MTGKRDKHDTDACIYLIHGFASAPKYPSDKADALARAFGLSVKQLGYDSAATFKDNLEALKAQVDAPPQFFVGTSLGAFYAARLAETDDPQIAMPILLNPCHDPATSLKSSAGMHTNFATGNDFELTEAAIHSYRGVPFIDASKTLPGWILLNMDDERIDAHETQSLYHDKLEVIAFEHGGHRFENIGSAEVTAALARIKNQVFTAGATNA